VVLCGGSHTSDENATVLQLAAIMANVLIGAYGTTLHFDRGWMPPSVNVGDTKRFLEEGSKLDFLIVIDANPAFTLPPSSGIDELLKGIKSVVTINVMPS